MTILITTIPDDPKEWAGWLEQHLVGLRLRDLAEELVLLPNSAERPLQEILNKEDIVAVREVGLSSLAGHQMLMLLAAPKSLLDLQEDVLLNGGEYWTSITPLADMNAAIERVRGRQNAELVDGSGRGKRQAGSLPHSGAGFQPAIKRRSLFVLATAAAVLLIGVTLWRMQPAGSGTMLGKSGLLANDVTSSAEYLNRIADAGNEWFDQDPRDSTQLIALLQNVSNDCQLLIDADHKALMPDERDWFVTKCQNWKKQFDATLASLQSDQLTFDDAKSAADTTMKKLVNVLRTGPTA